MSWATSLLAVGMLVLHPAPMHQSRSAPCSSRRRAIVAQSIYSKDGGESETDWDAEAAALARPANSYFKTIKDIPVPDLISEFATSAPPEVQEAVRLTVRQLLGNMPAEVAAVSRLSSDKSIASLMFSMQMTGYMFRNAQYRRSLLDSIDGTVSTGKVPEVSGTISVQIAEGMKAEVDAAAYMAELRGEVEELRSQIMVAKQKQTEGGPGGLVAYMQSLPPEQVQELTASVSSDVLDAMGLLVNSILKEANTQSGAVVETSDIKLRELLVWQLVTGYKLRELEVKEELKDKFWGADADTPAS